MYSRVINKNVLRRKRVWLAALATTLLAAGLYLQPTGALPDQRLAFGFDENSGTVARDVSEQATNATITSGTWTNDGKYGKAIDFNGTTTRVQTGSNVALSNTFTMQAWVYNPSNQSYETLVTVGQAGSNRNMYLESGVLKFYNGSTGVSFTNSVGTNAWHHVAVTYDGTSIRGYIDGVQQGSAQALSMSSLTGQLQVGALAASGNASHADYFSGTLDEVRIYNRALNVTEIANDMNSGVSSVTPENIYLGYGFSENTGTVVKDGTANARHATATSPTWTTSGHFGTAISFNGSTTRVRSDADATVGTAFSVEAWVNNPSFSGYETIAAVGGGRTFYFDNGVLGFWDGTNALAFGSAVTANTWNHVAFTYDGSYMRAYVNGVQRGTAQPISLSSHTGRFQVGAAIDGSSNVDYLSGIIDDVRLYGRTLTVTEVQSAMATPVSNLKLGVYKGNACEQIYDCNETDGPAGWSLYNTWLGSERLKYGIDFGGNDLGGTLSTWEYFEEGWPEQFDQWSTWKAADATRKFVLAIPMILPHDTGTDAQQITYCANGDYDAHYENLAANLVSAGLGDSVIRIGWEAQYDGLSYSYSVNREDWRDCWRQISSVMKAEAPNLVMNWNISTGWETAAAVAAEGFSNFYPGDDVVDEIGIDTYNNNGINADYATYFGDGVGNLGWFVDIAAEHNKPLSIPEWGLWDNTSLNHSIGSRDDADYIQRMYHWMNNPANRVAWASYFDVNVGTYPAHQLQTGWGDGTYFPNASAKYQDLFGDLN